MSSHATEDKHRKVGFEIELAGLSIDQTSQVVVQEFGGQAMQDSSAEYSVNTPHHGQFKIELDAIPAKKLAAWLGERHEKAATSGSSFQAKFVETIDSATHSAASTIAPLEIVTPPLAVKDIPRLDTLCNRLRQQNAEGTKASFQNTFGLHINPEVMNEEPKAVINVMAAFAIMFPWLKREHGVDLTRHLSPFIEPYENDYVDLIASENGEPSWNKLITDYQRHNPTRNRALDMLPMMMHKRFELVRSLYGPDEKINARPTFHYRLPNCELAQPHWSVSKEWRRWLIVEQAASRENCLSDLKSAWHASKDVTLFENKNEFLINQTTKILEKHNVVK